MSIPVRDWELVFQSMRDVVVLLDARTYSIVGISQPLLDMHSARPEYVMGRELFDAFPPQPGSNIRLSYASWERVKKTKQPDILDRVSFDIRKPDGTNETHYWIASHHPVMSEDGSTVEYIMVYADDVTQLVALDDLAGSLGDVGDALRSAVDVIISMKLKNVN